MEARRLVMMAGPGSGKTHTLIARIAHDAERIDPRHLVVVTFTNAGAVEIRERLEARGLPLGKFRHIGTLHSWATRALNHAGNQGVLATDKQIDEIIQAVRSRLGSSAKNMTGKAIWAAAVRPPKFGTSRSIGMAVRTEMKAKGLTHHDLILEDFAAAMEADMIPTPGRIYVDEYQDSGPTDERIYNAAANQGSDLFMIGDPRQSIYGFRGADPGNLDRAYLAAGATATLTRNFRSTPQICSLAASIAERMNDGTWENDITSNNPDGPEPRIQTWSHAIEEALAIVDEMSSTDGSKAVLVRYNEDAKRIAAIARAKGLKVTCSADQAEPDQRETIEQSAAKAAAFGIQPPGTDWSTILTRAGVPFRNQEMLLPRIQAARYQADLEAIAQPDEAAVGEIHIGTIHSAKGREWDQVWVAGMSELNFPSGNPEAGRLAFVAVTRARTHLTISHAERAPDQGGRSLTSQQRSAWIPSTTTTR